MKTCPNCKELVGDNVSKCFNCGWNFDDPSENERAIEREKKRKEEEEALRRRRERQSAIARKNNTYEYNVIRVRDNLDGTCNDTQISFEIGLQAKYGWRLHSIYSNEIGKTSSPTVTGGQTNATICETVIVMERLVAFAEENHD